MVTAVRPGGVVLDLQVIRPNPRVEVDGRVVCEIDGEPLFRLADAAAAAVDSFVATGRLIAEAGDDHDLFKALADRAPVRRVNLRARRDEPVGIRNLIEPLGLSQPTVSHHMKKLLDAGLVDREQRGRWAYFSLKRDAVEKLAAVADLKG